MLFQLIKPMSKTGIIALLLLFVTLKLWGQTDSTAKNDNLQISLLTCGAGSEIYSVFGHTAVRILNRDKGTDIVYNYGTFDGYEEDFELKFMRGKLLYYLSEENYQDFIAAYKDEGRWVKEQIIQATESEKKAIQSFLMENMQPENRAYKYDFFFDNCATRIRDIFSVTFGNRFVYPIVLSKDKKISFRDIINRYLQNNVWERLGINIVLGSKIDAPMTNTQIMFLPDYLMDAMASAQLDAKPIVQQTNDVIKGDNIPQKKDYSTLLVLYGLLILFLTSQLTPQLHFIGNIITNFMLFVSGTLGLIILVMWLGTDHQTCSNNFNLLWALPTNLFFIFRKKQFKYAVISMLLILLSFLLHLIHIQQLLLPEMVAILLLQLLIMGTIYRKRNTYNATN